MTAAQRAEVAHLADTYGPGVVLLAAAHVAGRDRVAGIVSRRLVDATAGEEVRPCSDVAPGHDLDAGGGQ